VKLELKATSGASGPSAGSFSVAVTDEDKVPIDSLNEQTIESYLLLTSELKGRIEQPNYYFLHPSDQTRSNLDNLLLTQGYRHFIWKQDTATYPAEQGMQISGTVKKNGRPVAGAKVKLFSNTGGMFMLDTLTDQEGRFAFKGLLFADSTKFVVQSRVKKGQDDVTLELDTVQPPALRIMPQAPDTNETISAALSAYTDNQQKYYEELKKYGINQHPVMLREVKVEAKKELPIPHSQNLNGSGNADYVITAKDIDKMICGRLADCLQGVYNLHFANGLPLVGALVIDGTFVDIETFADLRPEDIEGIEILTDHSHYNAIYGSRMAGGGLIITTKRGRRTDNLYYRYAPGVVTYQPKGFYKAREFYSPQYDNPHTNQKMADLRSTIYWNPDIITDKDGKASFSYFNADGKGTYRVVVEGIDADGNISRQVYHYTVE
ncbi:MAG TPA: hypothetical protein VHA56_12725, partial [Mucilaginibacter sp.]|nr:hypothetical protein [Mucilaginibacter sp.]